MKQKLKQPAQLFLAIFLLFSVVNCTKDSFEDTQNLQPNEDFLTLKAPFQIDYLSADQAPVFVKEMLPLRNRDNNATSSNNYTDTETGAVFDEQTIMKVTDTLGNTNYTIRFGFPRTPERIFYNLIVSRDAQGVMNVPYIVRYVSDSTAFDGFKNSRYDFRKFRGKITYHKYADFFGTDKSLIGDLVIANRTNNRGQTTIDAQTACEPDLDEFGDPIACETITLSGGTCGSSGGSSGSGDGLNPGDTAGTDSGVDSGSPPGDGSTSGGGSDGTGREQEDPIDPVDGKPCCDLGFGGDINPGRVVITESYVITTETWPSGNGSCSQTTVTSSKTYSDGTTEYSSRTSGIDCVSFNETGTIKTAANSFEECPECTPPADGGVGVLPPKGSTEEVVSEEEQIVNNLTNPYASEIFSNLREENFQEDFLKPEILLPSDKIFLTFSQSILKLFNELEFIKYTVRNGTLDGSAGQTGPFERGILTTISDLYLQNATKLSIARTMIHESVHAYILYKNSSLDFDFRQSIELFGKENGYDIKVDPNKFHHEFMGQYINAMAYSLLQWDKKYGSGGNLGWEYYHAMAFGGLFFKDSSGNLIETNSFKELVPNSLDRKKIINILKNEEQGNSSSKGIKC